MNFKELHTRPASSLPQLSLSVFSLSVLRTTLCIHRRLRLCSPLWPPRVREELSSVACYSG
ncbi:hypothetical protein RchiOBHm_Chr2g0097021 [Rosa chinensis]|uniref:Uncharacterized protein n=2 Tax=Rosa chinensis TaxID=74649 RepID=A0A2P6RL73_ROSCH|nr:hypothetical protein RchiOBHm_Chr2g0097021 [Rosa chinensis]